MTDFPQQTRTPALRFLQKLFPPRIEHHRAFLNRLRDKYGLEIGGPSKVFGRRGIVPVYPVISGLDGCNFSSQTIWEGNIQEGEDRYRYAKGKKAGHQFINDAVTLKGIANETYDFIISCGCLEHIANPLKALFDWIRVIKVGGHLLLLVPHKDGTFDHRRPLTTFEHLIDDLDRSVGEDDLTHLPEILELHDLSLDPPAGDPEQFRQRSLRNIENRCLHHHTFNTELAARTVQHTGLRIIEARTGPPFWIAVLAKKTT